MHTGSMISQMEAQQREVLSRPSLRQISTHVCPQQEVGMDAVFWCSRGADCCFVMQSRCRKVVRNAFLQVSSRGRVTRILQRIRDADLVPAPIFSGARKSFTTTVAIFHIRTKAHVACHQCHLSASKSTSSCLGRSRRSLSFPQNLLYVCRYLPYSDESTRGMPSVSLVSVQVNIKLSWRSRRSLSFPQNLLYVCRSS